MEYTYTTNLNYNLLEFHRLRPLFFYINHINLASIAYSQYSRSQLILAGLCLVVGSLESLVQTANGEPVPSINNMEGFYARHWYYISEHH